MELALIILAIGFAFALNSSEDKSKLLKALIDVDKKLQSKFDEQDKRISKLERELENGSVLKN